MKNDWLTTEVALLHKHYASAPSAAELMALFPRHTAGSVHRMARIEGLSRPLAGVVKVRPGLDRMLKLLESDGPLSAKEISERLGIKRRSVENVRSMYQSAFRVALGF